jgi:DNA-binding FrmR family transcriptional regulator
VVLTGREEWATSRPAGDLIAQLQKRLRFIEGQARGVQGMLDNGRDLTEVLMQLGAIQSAAGAAATLITQERVIGQIKESIGRVIGDCGGPCASCHQLEDVMAALEQLDYSSLVDELVDTRRANGARSKG